MTPISGLDAHPNALAARALWEAVADADAEALTELLAPDVEWHVYGNNPLAGDFSGPDGVLDYLARVGDTADDLRSTLRDLFVSEDGAVIAFVVDGQRGERTIHQRLLLRMRVRESRIVEVWSVPLDQPMSDAFWS